MFIIRGVNVYPGQIDALLSQETRVGSEYQVLLTRESGRDHMKIKVERGESTEFAEDEAIAVDLQDRMRRRLLVRGTVELVDYGSLPRTERKSKRVFDERNDE